MILLYIYFKRLFFLNLKGVSDGEVVLLTKKENGSALYFYRS